MARTGVVGRYLERTFDQMADVVPRGLAPEPPPWQRTTEPAWLQQLPTVDRDPEVEWSTAVSPSAAAPLDLDVLATLLSFGAGTSSVEFGPQSAWRHHRIVPSARCIYPVSVWVAGGEDTSDRFDAGRYFAEHHQLRYRQRPQYGRWTRVVVVVTATIGAVGQHYGDYAYRLVCQEAGLIAGNILLVARSLGIAAVRDGDTADTWAARLGIDGDRELAMTAIQLSGAPTAVANAPVTGVRAVDRRCAPVRDLGSLVTATHREFAATPIRGDGDPGATAHHRSTRRAPRPATWRTVRAARDSGDPGFIPSPRPISADVCDRLRAAANAPAFAAVWAGTPGLTVLTAAVRVTGLPPGVYAHDREHRAGRVVCPDVLGFLTRCQMLMSTNAHLAAATFFFVTRPDQWLESHGPRAYVDLHLKAGELAQRMLVAASAEKLVARIHNGFLTDAVRALCPDGPAIAPFVVMAGHRRPSARYRLAVDADR